MRTGSQPKDCNTVTLDFYFVTVYFVYFEYFVSVTLDLYFVKVINKKKVNDSQNFPMFFKR